VRIFFATDIHGSEACWRKFLRCADFYGAEVLVLGGDMTGKGLVPILDHGGGRHSVDEGGRRVDFAGEDDLRACLAGIRERGLYPWLTTPDELASVSAEEGGVDAVFETAIRDTVERWVALAEERLPSGVRCFVCPGNDDIPQIDPILQGSTRLEVAEGRVLPLADGYSLASTGWSNETPWDTHREEPEEDLGRRITAVIGQANGAAPKDLIFNFHCPPHGTALDEAPRLDADLRMVDGGRSMAHVGSTAVRAAIETVQPTVSLHGHIHESRGAIFIGRTLSVNPGSSYELGVLQGAVITLRRGRKPSYQLVSG
jgi:Icc-related predicted phosphoesterase